MIAGIVKGVTGLGLPTVGVGLLSLVMPPSDAAALVIVPSLTTNIWQLVTGPSLPALVRRLWPMQVGVFAGTMVGGVLLAGAGGSWVFVALGGVLMVYAIVGLSPLFMPRVSPRAELTLGPVVGFTTGVISSVTGVFIMPAVPYLQCLGLDREPLIQALGLSFTVSSVALALALANSGVLDANSALVSVLTVIPAFAGMVGGQFIRRAVDPLVFRRCFFGGLLLLGAHLALRDAL